MTLWPNPKRWHHSLRGDDIHEVPSPPAENQPNGFGVKEHSGTLNDINKRPEKVPPVLTHHPTNQEVTKTLLKNFHILTDDSSTKVIFNSKPLCVYQRNTSLRDILQVHSTFSTRVDLTLTEPAEQFPCHTPQWRTRDFTGRTETFTSTYMDVRLKEQCDCTEA